MKVNSFEMRLLVLLENEKGKFEQVLLTPSQFKKVSDTIGSKSEHQPEDMRQNMQMYEVEINEDWEMDSDKFIGLSSINKNV